MHSVETQEIIQVIILASNSGEGGSLGLVSCPGGYAVPSSQRVEKMKKVKVLLVRGSKAGQEVDNVEAEKIEVEKQKDADIPNVSI